MKWAEKYSCVIVKVVLLGCIQNISQAPISYHSKSRSHPLCRYIIKEIFSAVICFLIVFSNGVLIFNVYTQLRYNLLLFINLVLLLGFNDVCMLPNIIDARGQSNFYTRIILYRNFSITDCMNQKIIRLLMSLLSQVAIFAFYTIIRLIITNVSF